MRKSEIAITARGGCQVPVVGGWLLI